ncbi:hypothetical protein D3C87_504690 [compost metagenome]
MWSAINKRNGRVRDGFEEKKDVEDFLIDFFKGRASVVACDEEKMVIDYVLDV